MHAKTSNVDFSGNACHQFPMRDKSVARIVSRAADPKKQNFPVLKGHPVAQEHVERAFESHDFIRKKDQVLKEFKIYRWSPDHPNNKPYLHSYFVDLTYCGPMVNFQLFPTLFLFSYLFCADKIP